MGTLPYNSFAVLRKQSGPACQNDLAGRGVERITPEAPADCECLFVHLTPSFSWKRSRVAQQLAFCTLALPPSAARMLAAMPAWSRSAFTTPSFSASFFFCSAALLVERATKKQITAATASSTGSRSKPWGRRGPGQRRRQSRRRTNQGQHQKSRRPADALE